MDLKDILFGLILFVVFASLIITPIIAMAGYYDKDTSEVLSGALSIEEIDDSFEDISSSTETYRSRYSTATDKAEEGDREATGWGSFGIIGDTVALITTPFTLLAQILSQVIKIPTAYINVILGILGLSIILALWKLWKQGI